METLRELVLDHPALVLPNADAFRVRTHDDIRTISQHEFRNDVYNLGGWLVEHGYENCVCIYGEDCYEWAVAHITLTCGAGIAVGLDRELPINELTGQIRQCEAKALLYTRKYTEQAILIQSSINDELQCYCLDDLLISLRKSDNNYGARYSQKEHGIDDVVAIFFTSGTTGTTKGIQLTQRNLIANISAMNEWTHYTKDDALLHILPMHHCYACLSGIYLLLVTGTAICICDSIRRIVDNIRLFKPNTIHAVPMIYEMLMKLLKASGKSADDYFETHFKWFISGGAALSRETAADYDAYGIPIYNGYGATECSSAIIVEDKARSHPGSIGKPLGGCEVQIIDGEICVRGDVVFKGYLNDDEATKSVLYDGWFHTGDLGFIDEDGFVTITGRKKNLIILENGKNVSPEELERDLSLQIPQIQEVQVYELNGCIAAEIYPKLEITGDAQEFFNSAIAAFNRKQPLHRQIRQVIVRDQPFPRTSTQKMIRKHVGK